MKRDELESIAAELMERQVYVALQSEGVPEEVGGPIVGGCYSKNLDLQLQQWLQAQGRWQGRQPAIYVDDTRNEDWFPFAWAVHEMAHIADMGFSGSQFVFKSTLRQEKTDWIEQRNDPPKVDTTLGYDPFHGPRFVRACCHLWHRAMSLGCAFSPEHIYEGKQYNVPEAWTVLDALDDEPRRLEQLRVETILILPAPAAFNELFEGCNQ
jgi:hypothetical protein